MDCLLFVWRLVFNFLSDAGSLFLVLAGGEKSPSKSRVTNNLFFASSRKFELKMWEVLKLEAAHFIL